MNRHRNPLFVVASMGMELCWMCALAYYTCLLIYGDTFPLPMALTLFIFSIVTTSKTMELTRIRGLIILLQVFSFLVVTSVYLLISNYWLYDGFQNKWVVELPMHPQMYQEWIRLIVISVWTVLFWVAGIAWFKRAPTHQSVCNRFDLGLALFFALFLIKLLLLKRFELANDLFDIIYLLILFFVFGLFAVGYAKNYQNRPDLPVGYHGLSILFFIALSVLLFGTGAFTVYFPHSRSIAQVGYNVCIEIAKPLLAWGIDLLIVIFNLSPRTSIRLRTAVQSEGDQSFVYEGAVSTNAPLMYGVGIVYGALLMVIIGYLLWKLFNWLALRLEEQQPPVSRFAFASRMFRFLRLLVVLAVVRFDHLKRKNEIGFFYLVLVKWGKSSGVFPHASETPLEYSARLIRRFPEAQREVTFIVNRYNECVYGGIQPDMGMIKRLHAARKNLYNPKLWPKRLKSWFRYQIYAEIRD